MQRFASWLGLAELEPPVEVSWTQAFDLAAEDGTWHGVSFFIYEQGGWTVFEDMTGFLGSKSGQDLLRLAKDDELVFAGYNDAVPYGQLVVIRQQSIIREFLDDEQDPANTVSRGHLDFEDMAPIQNWIDAASFVDSDDLAVSPDSGTLWTFQEPSRTSPQDGG